MSDHSLCLAKVEAEEAAAGARAQLLSVPMVEQYRRDSNLCFAKSAAKFAEAVSEGPRKPPPGVAFPKTVKYDVVCGELCTQQTPQAKFEMYRAICDAFRECAKRFNTCAQLIVSDVVLSLEVFPVDAEQPHAGAFCVVNFAFWTERHTCPHTDVCQHEV